MAIKDLKKILLENKLSYASQDYEAILKEVLDMFAGDNPISENWNNMSQSDPLFILISLFSAHKDILNYMIDYRIKQSYMSTALERAAMVRNADSFGYKIPSYRAAVSNFKLSAISPAEFTNAKIKDFTVFLDESTGNSWTYIKDLDYDQTIAAEDDLYSTFALSDELRLYQGIPVELTISPENIDTNSMTHIISNQNIAIGNSYDTKGCSKIVLRKDLAAPVVFQEVESLILYKGEYTNVYELNVDAQGITYVKFNKTMNLSAFAGYTMTLYVIATQGQLVYQAPSAVKGNALSGTTSLSVSLSPATVNPLFISGLNPATEKEIKEGFTTYYAGIDSLVTLKDYKNFILNIQKVVPGIKKCYVADVAFDSEGNPLYDVSPWLGNFEVAIYMLKENNVQLTTQERLLLSAALSQLSLPPIVLFFDRATENDYKPLTERHIKLKSGIALATSTKQAIVDYINKKQISSSLDQSEIYSLIATSFSTEFKPGLLIQLSEDNGVSYTNSLPLEVGKYLIITEADITA